MSDYEYFLGKPHSSIEVPGLNRDSSGNYNESLGWNDPLHVFSLRMLKGEPVIRVSGQVDGALTLRDSLYNYHLKLNFKWGDILWDWKRNEPKDAGILYHIGNGVQHEFQIREGEVGSYQSKNILVNIPAKYLKDENNDFENNTSGYSTESVKIDTVLIFDPGGFVYHFPGTGNREKLQVVHARPVNENLHGEWNSIELICWNNNAVHLVNGKINMVILNAYYVRDGQAVPLVSGGLAIESKGAEIYFRDIVIKELVDMPEILERYMGRRNQ